MRKRKKRAYMLIHVDEQTKHYLQGMRDERKKCGISRRELAELTGISYSSLSDYEEGRYAPTLKRYIILAEFFGWDIKDSPNYKIAKITPSKLQTELKKRKKMHGFSKDELSRETKFSAYTVEKALYISKARTANNLAAVLEVLDEEERRSKLTQELTRKSKI